MRSSALAGLSTVAGLVLLAHFGCGARVAVDSRHDQLKVTHTGKYDEVEIGSKYVGLELLNGSPLLNRISFYYPVANSVDLTRDYWKRGEYPCLFLGLKSGDAAKEWIGLEPWQYELTPYAVAYTRQDDTQAVTVSYDFTETLPAFRLRILVRNRSDRPLPIELYTHLEATQRTSHTYAIRESAWTEHLETGETIYINFEAPDTGPNQLFVTNVGAMPSSFSTRSRTLGTAGYVPEWWATHDAPLPGETIPRGEPDRPAAAFQYHKVIEPDEVLEVEQLIGSTRPGEARDMVEALRASYRDEILAYRGSIQRAAFARSSLRSSDRALDHSVNWAQAILAANNHYIDGSVVPMPEPAEYNFYFTHDVLLADLAAVHFDLARASDEHVIPHAYYWKDDRYRTEWASSDSWNHLWFVIVASSYLRHSGDTATVRKLYPYMEQSLSMAMSNRRADGLLWAERPDWWDIGHVYGPRAYMTILAFRALRDFAFTSLMLGQKTAAELKHYEDVAAVLQAALTERLWDEELGYLINVNPGNEIDRHLYSGSLLAAHYGLLDSAKTVRLTETAGRHMIDEQIGLYNAYPMDFHERIEEYGFSGGEAGDPYYYFNGGVWPHGNAWYALALMAVGRESEALEFVKNVMTLEGVMESPNGQPAMYEFRNANSEDHEAYGQLDKPQFTWAAAWYLYALYRLFGVRENEWNIAIEPFVPETTDQIEYGLTLGGSLAQVRVRGTGSTIRRLLIDGRPRSSAVILGSGTTPSTVEVELGEVDAPYLASTEAIVVNSGYRRRSNSLQVVLKAFAGHSNRTEIVSAVRPVSVVHNRDEVTAGWSVGRVGEAYRTQIQLTHTSTLDTLVVRF
ncbi:MAG: hypothetical protein P8Y26_05710 [Gemmatimonadales bacterium]